MKKSVIVLAAAMLMTGCGFTKNSTSNNTTNTTSATQAAPTFQSSKDANSAMTAGQAAGNALQALYAQYVADGKEYDYKNMQNILNTMTLMANCEGLKKNYKDKTYLMDFGKGMVASSLGLVTQDNVETVTSSLVDMVKSSENVQKATTKVQDTANQAAGYANTAAQYAGALSKLLGVFGGQ